MTLTDLKEAAKRRNYIVRKLGGEIEIYPKGRRGDASYFTNDVDDAFQTMRGDWAVNQMHVIKKVVSNYEISPLLPAETALIAYAAASGRSDWTNRLFDDWYRAGSTTVDRDTYATLHRLRNSPHGHDILRDIASYKASK